MNYRIMIATNGITVLVPIPDGTNDEDVFQYLNRKYNTTFRAIGELYFDFIEEV